MTRIPAMQAVVDVLGSEGVDTVFGCPGANILPLYAALRVSHIDHLIVRHEEAPPTWRTAGRVPTVVSALRSAPRAPPART